MNLLRRGLCLGNKDMKRVLAITMPAMLELVFSQLFGMVDTIMLGRTSMSAIAIAAVGLTNNPVNLAIGILSAVNVGATAAVAWAIGAGDDETAKAVTRNMLVLDMIFGVLAMTVGMYFAKEIVTFMEAEADTLPYATEYLRIVSTGFLPAAITMGVTASMRGAGLTRMPMAYNLFSNLLNVFGNYVFIYGKLGLPAMGVAGAALSTTLSRYVALALSLGVLFIGKSRVRLSLRQNYLLRWPLVRQIFRVGLPGAIEQCIMQVGFMFFTRTVAVLGTTLLAAHQIGLSINGLAWVPSQAFGVAATTLVGQSLGAGNPFKARDQAKFIHRCSLIGAALVGLLFLAGAHLITSLYTNDPAVIAYSAKVLRIMALGMPGIATQQPISAALRGARDSLFPLIASATGIWVFRVLVAPFFVHTLGWGLDGAWLSIVLDQTTRGIVVYIRFIKGKWMTNASSQHVIEDNQ